MSDEKNIQKERLQLALRASNEGVWLWDLSLNEIEYSDKVLHFIGYSAANAPHLFSHLESLYHPEDAHKLQDVLDEVFSPNGPEVFGGNFRFHHPNNTWRWLRIRGACVRDADQRVIRLAGSIIDITKRKEAERALEEERYLLNMLIESIPVNIYFKDKDSKFVMSNTATAKKMGLSCREELIGKSDHDFFAAKHADKSKKNEVMIMYTQEKLDGSLERETWEGQSDSWCITSKHPWLDSNGHVRGTFGVTDDVTDIVETQARLVNVAKQLKHRNVQYEEELSLANEVQQSILIKNIPPLSYGDKRVDIYPEYLPMDGLAGDFYEVVTLSKHRAGILMCDVMGHGTRAALIVAMLRGLISKEQGNAHEPDVFLYGLNQGLTKIMHRAGVSMFATAIYVLIDIELGTLTFSEAGHPLPIIREGGVYRQLSYEAQSKSPALGLVQETMYHSQTLQLSDFSEFLMFTDGIYETINDDDTELEVSGVLNILQNNLDAGESGTKALLRSLRAYSKGNHFNDDVCMINVRTNN